MLRWRVIGLHDLNHLLLQSFLDFSILNRGRLPGVACQIEQQGLKPFLEEWRQLDRMIGKTVTIDTPNGKVNGVMKNISDKGELILLCENNQEKRYLSGELSLRLAEQG